MHTKALLTHVINTSAQQPAFQNVHIPLRTAVDIEPVPFKNEHFPATNAVIHGTEVIIIIASDGTHGRSNT
jgi:hypothetical protein